MANHRTYARRRAQGLCGGCGERPETGRAYCNTCRQYFRDYHAYTRAPETTGIHPEIKGPMIAGSLGWHAVHLDTNEEE